MPVPLSKAMRRDLQDDALAIAQTQATAHETMDQQATAPQEPDLSTRSTHRPAISAIIAPMRCPRPRPQATVLITPQMPGGSATTAAEE